MKKVFRYFVALIISFTIIYFLGPTPPPYKAVTSLPLVPGEAKLLNEYILNKEKTFDVKEDNEARIVWADDSAKTKTKYSIVYLHGFSASQGEGFPSHLALAKQLNANLFLARLHNHGLKGEEALLNYSSTKVMESAAEALAIGNQLGDSVILVGTSTGGTCALALAAQFPEKVAGLVLFSPNIRVADPRGFLLNDPWGLQITRMVYGSNYQQYDGDSNTVKYWDTKYRLEALIEMQELLEETMIEETFNMVKCPVYIGYYYKNEVEQDDVVSVQAMLEMFNQLGSEDKVAVPFPQAGDHVIASAYKTEHYQDVINDVHDFLKDRFTPNQ